MHRHCAVIQKRPEIRAVVRTERQQILACGLSIAVIVNDTERYLNPDFEITAFSKSNILVSTGPVRYGTRCGPGGHYI